MQSDEIKSILQAEFPDALIEVNSDDEVHFAATIVDDSFQDQPRVQRQRRVYNVLSSEITLGRIHALSLATMTKQEYKNK